MTYQPPRQVPLEIFVHEAGNGADIAATSAAGVEYAAKSSSSATFKLCRDLAAAGVTDSAFQVISKNTGTVSYSGASWHRLAGLTVMENDRFGPRVGKFRPMTESGIASRKSNDVSAASAPN